MSRAILLYCAVLCGQNQARSLDRLVAPLGAKYGHDEIVKDLLLGCASLLVFGNATLNAVMFEGRRRRYRGVPWRAPSPSPMAHIPPPLFFHSCAPPPP